MSNPDIDRLYDRVSALFKLVEQKDRRIDRLNTALSAANDSINAALDRICELERTVVRVPESALVSDVVPDDDRAGSCSLDCQVACQVPLETTCQMADQPLCLACGGTRKVLFEPQSPNGRWVVRPCPECGSVSSDNRAVFVRVKREKHRVEVLIIHVDSRLMRTFGTTLATDGKTRIISAPGEPTKVYPEAILVGDATTIHNHQFPCEADAIDYEERVSRLFDSIIVDESQEEGGEA
jgi:hypothetical protein